MLGLTIAIEFYVFLFILFPFFLCFFLCLFLFLLDLVMKKFTITLNSTRRHYNYVMLAQLYCNIQGGTIWAKCWHSPKSEHTGSPCLIVLDIIRHHCRYVEQTYPIHTHRLTNIALDMLTLH